jgi:uncharacterized NAD(P)/FAD-binding protein YdhS
MHPGAPRTIAIVGAGFSGTLVTVNLLRRPPVESTRIVLIEREPEVGRGIAYARRDYRYILNVPASRMSATSTAPDEFLEFARTRIPDATGQDFLPREVYGDYLRELLDRSAAKAAPSIRLELLNDSVTEVRQLVDGAGFRLMLERGGELNADDVVLAPGNPPPRVPPEAEAVRTLPGYVNDPWAKLHHAPAAGPVLIIGSGLTMVDVVCATVATEPACTIHVLSRHGLLPLSQTDIGAAAVEEGELDRALKPATSLRSIVRAIANVARRATADHRDWRDVIMQVRHRAPAIWNSLTLDDRRRFLRHVRAYWDVHRHRFPEPIRSRLEHLEASGQLTIHAGRLRQLEAAGSQIRVRWRARGERDERTMLVNGIHNCSGPDYDLSRSAEPLWRSLLKSGLTTLDELHLGLRTGPRGELLGRNGLATHGLYYVGPMLRASHWEATAVAELRGHAERLADELARPLPQSR